MMQVAEKITADAEICRDLWPTWKPGEDAQAGKR